MKEGNSTKIEYENEKNCYNDKKDFSFNIELLWKQKKLIIIGTIGATLLSAMVSLIIPRVYLSEGFFQLGYPKITVKKEANKILKESTSTIGIPVPFYKRGSTLFFNPNRFQFFADKDILLTQENKDHIKTRFRTSEEINKWIKPVYAYAKEDVREFAQLPVDESNSVLGLKISYEAGSPEEAHDFVKFFGNHVRDCLMHETLYNYIIDELNNTEYDLKKIENDIIRLKFQMQLNILKLNDIKSIVTSYPESAKIENRQLVSLQDGGARFLSPVTQMIGIESGLADMRQTLLGLENEKDKLTNFTEFFLQCKSQLSKINERGEDIFSFLKSIKLEIFDKKSLTDDIVKEVYNKIDMDLQMFESAFFNNCRFVSGPTVPAIHIKPRRSIIVMLSCVISFFIMATWVHISDWWLSKKRNY